MAPGGPTLKSIPQIIVSCADLLEAEGRALRSNVVNSAVKIAGVLAAALLVAVGFGFIVVAIFLAVWAAMGSPAWGALIAGLASLAAAGGVLWALLQWNR